MFHLSTVDTETYSILKLISGLDIIKKQFALAGGTSLALQIGHRKSIDLDFFTPDLFNPKELEAILKSDPDLHFRYSGNNSRMLFGYANNIKCDFIQETAKLIKPIQEFENIRYFHIQDIAAMKLHTICGRGKKKDFFDIYSLLQLFSWNEMLEWFAMKYSEEQFYFLWRSISYFSDADSDPDILGFGKFNKPWNEVKSFILQHCKQ